MKTKLFIYFLLLPLAFFGLASGTSSYNQLGYVQTGKASYYAEKFHGRLTANGERFNMYDMTCAHKKIQFNSLLEVTNLNNGKKIIVRVNDRGPFAPHRIIDLSKGAAKNIDMIRDGVVNIKIKIIRLGAHGETLGGKKEKGKTKKKTPWSPKPKPKPVHKPQKTYKTRTYSIWGTPRKVYQYGVQIGSYGDLKNAVKLAKKAMNHGFDQTYIQAGWTGSRKRVFRVLVEDKAKNDAEKVKWIVEDAAQFNPSQQYDLWHDRAAFHFLRDPNEIAHYVNAASNNITPHGSLVIGTFAKDGPLKCSGIEISQYNATDLTSTFTQLTLKESYKVAHPTPFDTIQNFTFCWFKK